MPRSHWSVPVAVALLITGVGKVSAQTPTSVDVLLEHSQVEDFLAEYRTGLEASLSQIGIETTPEMAQAFERQLAVPELSEMVRTEFTARLNPDLAEIAVGLVEDGALGRVESMAKESPPSSTLEEYAVEIQTNPPPQERIQLVAQVAASHAAGDFYVLVSERWREAAHVVASAVMTDPPQYEPLTDQEWANRAQQNLIGAVVSFLHRYEQVPDSELRSALEAWSSEAGVWYIQTYSAALGEVFVLAAEEVAAELEAR